MTISYINTGTSPNKGGDSLRTSFTKINNNFRYLSNFTNTNTINSGTGSVSTGNITFDNNKIIGFGTNGGSGLSTLELVPDNNLYGASQYIVIDPTVPNHIHIRAGGIQDSSNAHLILGAEKNNVTVADNIGIYIQNEYLESNYYNFNSTDFSNGEWYTSNGINYVRFVTSSSLLISKFWEFSDAQENILSINDGSTDFTLTYAGSASFIGNDTYRVSVLEAPTIPIIDILYITYNIYKSKENAISLSNTGLEIKSETTLQLSGNGVIDIKNYSPTESIRIITNYDDTEQLWSFGANGTLTFPDGSIQSSAFTTKSLVRIDDVPVSSSSAGQPNQVAFSGNDMYVCVSLNSWIKFTGTTF